MTKPKQICRKKGRNEPVIDEETQNRINELATQFQEDQFKKVLRRCYRNVQQYGAKAILQAIETNLVATSDGQVSDEFVKMEVEEAKLQAERDEFIAKCMKGIIHAHEETAQRNALFLIESSEARGDYDLDTIAAMRQMYERGIYDDVADLAYLHDRKQRPQPQTIDKIPCSPNNETKPESPWQRFSELLTEVVEEEDQKTESPIECCVEAIRCLSRDLTYENRTAAKDLIRRAIKNLE